MKNRTTVERTSDRELVITRSFNAPARMLFDAWAKPELLAQWWVPRSFGTTLHSCEADVRAGGTYRLVIGHPAAPEPMAFHGRYLEVTPPTRLVWTNEEAGGEPVVTTVTFQETAGATLVTVHELHPSKESLDAARASQVEEGMLESLQQLDELLARDEVRHG